MFLRPHSWACLHGHAMETHHLLLALPRLLRMVHTGSAYEDIRLRACDDLVALHEVYAHGGIHLSVGESAQALDLADDFLLCNNYLLKEAVRRGDMLYPIMTKHHHTWHIADMSRYQNPRWTACFEFEDFMGKIKRSAQASLAGSSLARIGSKVMEHFVMSLHLRMHDFVP